MERLKSWLEKSRSTDAIIFFDVNDVEINEKIGGGAFGHVHKARLLRAVPPAVVAVKLFKNAPDLETDPKTQEDLIREIKLLRIVDFHPHILRFFGVCEDPKAKTEIETYMLVLEYADGGSLREYLMQKKELPGRDRIRLAKETASGVACLHKNDIIHRDLNSANILVHQDHIKIADLGLSKKVEVKLTPSKVAIHNNNSKVQGHLQYIDPQCYIDMEYTRTRKSDVYSVGVVFWELSSGKIPFSLLSSTQAISRIINGVREKQIDGTPQKFVDLYTKCWDQEPENRPEIEEVYETLEGIEWETEVTLSTDAVSSDSEPKGDTSTSISEKIGEVLIIGPVVEVEAIPEESTVLLKRFFDAGKESDDIREYIDGYLRECNRSSRDLFEMLTNEGDLSESITNHPHALLVGFCYYKGIGVARSYARALEIFKQLAEDKKNEDDHPYVKYFIGESYRSGLGVDGVDDEEKEKNRVEAFKWFEESAKEGASKGQYELAGCYKYGWGTDKNIRKASEWYQKAADKKHLMARREIKDESWQNE